MVFCRARNLLRNAALIVAFAPAAAFSQTAAIGTLQCHISGGVGMILVENQALDCVYQGLRGGVPSHYIGRLTNVGANIGINGPGVMTWEVLAAVKQPAPGDLAGDYVGAQGDVAVGAGAGGAVLLGGSKNAFSLQPVSFSLNSGLDLSVGFGKISLQYMPPTPAPALVKVKRRAPAAAH
ncbi:DUF992 domain-containing protein [Methylocystis bryophila]|uniref:DUF992 domain-containing protein n=1 Tax=Methylocystis bryophila TaxID=655015 RepID=A0A1W6MTA5_9HYPH|nr:DUF992 domain-containing protein [Methylocystis bryophila]ARN80756.1 hypothetical protein B1812_06345 [Methylocystis bryophila]BDV40832.1 hypothetical protein DSM21852_40850 [Methylocystis bryophila]